MAKILIVGGAGFVGSHLADAMASGGHDVSVIDDLSNGYVSNLTERGTLSSLEYRWLGAGCDVSSHKMLRMLHEGNVMDQAPKWDAIYWLACWPRSRSFANPVRDAEVNCVGLLNVLELARVNDAKVVYASNSGIYDTRTLPISEHSEDYPTTPYDANKLAGEKYLEAYRLAYGLKSMTFRFATVYGPRQRSTDEWKPVIAEFVHKMLRGEAPTIYGSGEQTRSFVYVADIVGALRQVGELDERGGPLILGSDQEVSINALYRMVQEATGFSGEPRHGPAVVGDIKRMSYDCRYAWSALEWRATTKLEDGIAAMVKYARGKR